MRVELVDVRERPDHVDGVVHDDDPAGSAHGPDHGQRIKVHGHILDAPIVVDHLGADLALALVALPELEDLGRGSARDDRLERAARERAAADLVQQLPERDFSDLEFIVARPPHVAGDAEDAGSRVVGRSDLREGLAAHVGDVLHVAERLHVVHDRRALVEAEDGGEIRRLDPRIGPLALERLDQAGLLAADVRPRPAMDVDFAAVAGAEDVGPDEMGGPRLRDRLLQDPGAVRKLAPDVDVGLLHLVGEAGDHDPLDHLMRVLVDDVAVLEGAGLGLVGVDDQVDRLAALAIQQAPLEAAGKARAAPAAQARFLHLVHEFRRRTQDRLAQDRVAAMAHIAVQVGRVPRLVDVLENDAALFGHGLGVQGFISAAPPRPRS